MGLSAQPLRSKPARTSIAIISSGLTASDADCINCDVVEEIGQSIQKTLDNINVLERSLKRSMQVGTLVDLEKGVKINGENVHVDPNALFL